MKLSANLYLFLKKVFVLKLVICLRISTIEKDLSVGRNYMYYEFRQLGLLRCQNFLNFQPRMPSGSVALILNYFASFLLTDISDTVLGIVVYIFLGTSSSVFIGRAL